MALDDNPRGLQAIYVSAAFSGIAALVVSLRLYTRFFLVRSAGIEDYFVSLAMLCSAGLTICISIQARYGMGVHFAQLEHTDILHSLKAFYASLIVYYLSLGLTKTSILLQYLRVFPTKKFQIACYATMAVVILYTIWTLFGSILACLPARAFWTKEPGAKCINQFAMWFTNAGINILTDFGIIMLPMPVVRGLNLRRRQKQALGGVFAVGGFVCVVSILRLHSLIAISNSADPTYDNPPAATWSSVETNVGIICSCLPSLRPLIARCFPGMLSSSPYQYGANSYVQRSSRFSRTPFSRRSAAPRVVLPLESEDSRGFGYGSEGVEKDARIQVVTEVHVSVEGRDVSEGRKKEMGSGSSVETLV